MGYFDAAALFRGCSLPAKLRRQQSSHMHFSGIEAASKGEIRSRRDAIPNPACLSAITPLIYFFFQTFARRSRFPRDRDQPSRCSLVKHCRGRYRLRCHRLLMPISGHELVSLVRGVRSDIGVIFLFGADAPREPIPPDTIFRPQRPQSGARR
jgi:hypothetical protein